MANKTSKKSSTKKVSSAKTAKKTSTKTLRKPVQKKAQKVSYREASTTRVQTGYQSKYLVAGLALGWGFLAYGFASWAIDSGSLWHYLFTFISVYYVVKYAQRFITLQFKK
jgi:hypothetical protein